MIFTSNDGTTIYYESFCQKKPKASMLVVHGLGQHSGCYQEFQRQLAKQNIDVHTIDLRGHGRSDGICGHVKDFSQYHEDLSKWYHCLNDQGLLKKPIFLFGHSMGGLICLDHLLHYNEPFQKNIKGLALSTPALGLQTPMKVLQPFLDAGFFSLLEQLQVPTGISPEELSHDLQAAHTYKEDPLRHQKITVALFKNLLNAIQRVQKSKSKISPALLFLIAEQDTIIDTQAILAFAKSVSARDKQVKEFAEFYHEIFNESCKAKPYAVLFRWINTCLKKAKKPSLSSSKKKVTKKATSV